MTTSISTVTQWIERNARPLALSDSAGALTDLEPLREMVGEASVVALGASTRDTHELSVLAHQVLRFLVERMGFRSLVLEGDDATSAAMDRYVRTGEGDPRALLAEARSFWRTAEMLDVVEWVRRHNQRHPEDLVRIAHPELDRRVTVQSGDLGDIEKMLADNVIRWQRATGGKVVYWGGTAHTVNAAARTVLLGEQRVTHRSAGGRLRQHFGSGYVSVGLTFDHGATSHTFPSPPVDFADAALDSTDIDTYVLDLRTVAPGEVRTWLDSPAKMRLIGPVYDPATDADFHLSGGSLTEWFDIILHHRTVTSAHLIE